MRNMEAQRNPRTAALNERIAAIDKEMQLIRRKGETPFPRVTASRAMEFLADANSLSKSEKRQLKVLRREKRQMKRKMIGTKLIESAKRTLKELANLDPYL